MTGGESGCRVRAAGHAARRSPGDSRPALRVLHTLARTGGTVIGKCLAVMPGVVMLSEVNPAVKRLVEHPMTQRTPDVVRLLMQMDPLRQAHRWFGLLTPRDLEDLKARGRLPEFEDAIELIRTRAADRGQQLLIRDWSHLDYTAAPFIARPTHRRSTALALSGRYRVVAAAFVRHPIDQWLSIQNVPILRQRLALDVFLEGYRRFAEEARELGFVRYEDFTRDPDEQVRVMCERLELPFDPSYRERWCGYSTITGDTRGTRAQTEITPLPRRPVDDATIERFGESEDYRTAISVLGYAHP